MAGTACTATWHKSFPVGVTARTRGINKMSMICTIIICVVIRFRMAGLANAVPWLIILIEGKMVWPLLENCTVKGTCEVLYFFPNEAQINCLYIGVGICCRFRTVGIVTGPAINDTNSSIHHVIAHTAHACCLSARTVAGFAYGLLLFTPGDHNANYAILLRKGVAVITANIISRIMR